MANNHRSGVMTFGDLSVCMPTEYVCSATSLKHVRNKLCPHCRAWTWAEEFTNCCSNGTYVVEPLQPLPEDIALLYGQRAFVQNQRKYNGLFAFTALGASPSPTWTQPSYPSMLQLHGRAYHRIMDSFRGPYDERTPVINKARMYIYDAVMMQQANDLQGINMDYVSALSTSLSSNNSWISTYKSVLLEINEADPLDNVGIEFAQVNRQTHGSIIGDAPPPTGKEIAALIFKDDPDTRAKRYVYTFPRSGPTDVCDRPRFVPLWTPMYESLQYPLLFFHGEPGWSPGYYKECPSKKSQTLSITTDKPVKIWVYARQRILCESVFHKLSVVAQEWACDAYSRQEDNILDFIGSTRCQRRITSFNAIHKAVRNSPTGKRLPTSFHGSPANRKRRQLDAMSVVTRKGKPHLMITMTCNGNWPEIQDNLHPGQTALDRPDLCNRVFKIKLKQLMLDLTNNLFGKAEYYLTVIEFQKRGLVHAHIVVKFKGLSPEARHEVDKWIWANLPDARISNGKLREKVIKYMVHQKCGDFNPNAPCMTTCKKTNKKFCSKHYPQPFHDRTTTNASTGRAEYRRLDNGDKATIKQKNGERRTVETDIDNQWIVPYNPFLLMKFDCHICCDLVTAKAVIAYLYKYCFKGRDMARAKILFEGNEIEAYKSIRYISSSEAMWRIFGYAMQYRTPNVILLFVHLQGEHIVVHEEADDDIQRRSKANKKVSELMKYFARPSGPLYDDLTFLDYFENYTVQPKKRSKKRQTDGDDESDDTCSGSDDDESISVDHNNNEIDKDLYSNYVYPRRAPCVCRVNFCKPDAGDVWYLRLLLHHIASSGWEDIRTVHGIIYDTHNEAARQRGLVQDHEEYNIAFEEAIEFSTPRELRTLLVTLIIAGAPASSLWESHSSSLDSDFRSTMSPSAAQQRALRDIDLMLSKHGKTTISVGLPAVEHDNTEYDRLLHAFDRNDMRKQADDLVPKLNTEQRLVFDAVSSSIESRKGGVFMIDAPAGSGKTFTMCALTADLRANGKLVLCTASTGIAALLLPGGLTAHSTFKIPFGDNLIEGSSCNVKSESERAQVLRRADLIIWDEIPMSNKFAPEALDLTLRDLRRNDTPFGGATVLFSGDWRQVGPVIPFGTPRDVVNAAFISSYLWKHVQRFRLIQSMRDRLDKPYSLTVRAIGEGKIAPITLPDESIVIPLQHTSADEHTSVLSTCTITGVTDFEHLIDFVYPDLLTADPALFADRGILAPTNVSIDQINNHVLNLLPNPLHGQHSSNHLIKDNPNDIAEVTSTEYLEAVDVPGVPPHELNLKRGCVVMFIRNVNFDSGIVNGRKGIVRAISPRVVDVQVIAAGSPLVKIPRITFEVKVGANGITFHRQQFPLRVCYAVTINKSQGQTLTTVGLDLRDDVFCHGQLYVALSRTTASANIRCLVRPERLINGVPHVANCVYEQFILAATGESIPTFSALLYRPPNFTFSQETSPHNSLGTEPSWVIIDEIGDGACLLRAISRAVFHDPELHYQVRQQIVSHISQNHDNFYLHISNGFNNELIHILGLAPRSYSSMQDYLHIMSHPNSYAGYIEIAAAQQLYNISITVVVAGAANLPPVPNPPLNSSLYVMYHPHAMHYSTLSPH